MNILIEKLSAILDHSTLLLGSDISDKYHSDWSGADAWRQRAADLLARGLKDGLPCSDVVAQFRAMLTQGPMSKASPVGKAFQGWLRAP